MPFITNLKNYIKYKRFFSGKQIFKNDEPERITIDDIYTINDRIFFNTSTIKKLMDKHGFIARWNMEFSGKIKLTLSDGNKEYEVQENIKDLLLMFKKINNENKTLIIRMIIIRMKWKMISKAIRSGFSCILRVL